MRLDRLAVGVVALAAALSFTAPAAASATCARTTGGADQPPGCDVVEDIGSASDWDHRADRGLQYLDLPACLTTDGKGVRLEQCRAPLPPEQQWVQIPSALGTVAYRNVGHDRVCAVGTLSFPGDGDRVTETPAGP